MKQRNAITHVVVLFSGLTALLNSLACTDNTADRIRRITWSVHLFCWSMSGDTILTTPPKFCAKLSERIMFFCAVTAARFLFKLPDRDYCYVTRGAPKRAQLFLDGRDT